MAELVKVKVPERPNGPKARPMGRTSPALNEVLRTCPLRASFQGDHLFADARSLSAAAALGAVSHHLLEEASRGAFDRTDDSALPGAILQRWRELTDSEGRALQGRAYCLVPDPVRWPKYAIRRAFACKVASRIARKRNQPWAAPPGASPAQIQAEVWYEGYGGRLAGCIDLVRRTGVDVELVDYKSGLVIGEDDPEGAVKRVREPYERQVLLYSALIRENEGALPVRATVQSLIDGAHDVDVNPETVEHVVNEALCLLEDYNREVGVGAIAGRPSANTCRWCDFKAVCRDFLKSAEASWAGPYVTVVGELLTVHEETPSFISVDVTGGDHEKGRTYIRGVPIHLVAQFSGVQGSTVSFGTVRRTLGLNGLSFGWESRAWRWPHSD